MGVSPPAASATNTQPFSWDTAVGPTPIPLRRWDPSAWMDAWEQGGHEQQAPRGVVRRLSRSLRECPPCSHHPKTILFHSAPHGPGAA